MYCDIDLNEDESTVEGPKLKKGSTLLEMFPDGMCVVGINGMQTIIGVYAENHKDHIVSGIYHLQSFSGVGKGVSDAVDVKKEMDDLHSQTLDGFLGRPRLYQERDGRPPFSDDGLHQSPRHAILRLQQGYCLRRAGSQHRQAPQDDTI